MPVKRYTFPRTHRLKGRELFDAIYKTGIRESRGPLIIYAKSNDVPHLRMGLSVSRRVGVAAKRNRIKRLLRESFRLLQPDFPFGIDLLVVVKPHSPMILAEYQKLLSSLVVRVHNRIIGEAKPS
jgi:ribonuclease P protein component